MEKKCLLFLLFLSFSMFSWADNTLDSLLRVLDQTLLEHETYVTQRESRIVHLRELAQGVEAHSVERYNLNNQIYKEYKAFICDSAIHYLNENIRIADSLHDENRRIESKLQLSLLLSSTGMYTESIDVLESVDRREVDSRLIPDYYTCFDHVYGELSVYTQDKALSGQYWSISQAYRDSLSAILPPQSEEYTDVERPELFTAFSISGSAVEEGEVPMHIVSADGTPTNIFEAYTSFKFGEFSFKGTTKDGKAVNIGKGHEEGVLGINSIGIAASVSGVVRITVDLSKRTYTIVPVEEWSLVGSVTPNGWSIDKGVPLAYQGKGIWSGRVKLTGISGVSDRERFVFAMNKNWDYSMKRVKGTANEVGMSSQGYDTEDISLNHGTYHITLDLRKYVYYIDCGDEGIDPFKISVMGSSVANGQGATNNQGYAYMYGELLDERFRNQESKLPWFTSGIAVNGNNTLNLLDRYNELIHDCGKYVIFGLSLGNEGIHGVTDQQAVYNQFKENMQILIKKAREDGKYPLMMNNYTRGDFDASDYEYVKQMNLLIHEWDLPSVNLLGAIDNGSGLWADGYQNGTDIYHPNTDGHREFTYATVPSLLDAIEAGIPQPVRVAGTSYSLANQNVLEFTPEETVHPFTLSFKVKGTPNGMIASFTNGSETGTLKITPEGNLIYQSPLAGEIKGEINIVDNQWHFVSLTHYYAQGRTLLYTDKVLAGELNEKLTVGRFTIGDQTSIAERMYSELFFYRSAMNREEIEKLCEGKMLKSSLEIYAPLDGSKSTIENLAQSMNCLTLKAE